MVASRAVFVLLFFFVASLVVSSSTDNDKKEGENPTGSLTTISASEVASHNSPDNCWISFYGKVYDMSKFKVS
jgi:cytochrome b involved in lipid metabolism